MRPTDAPTDAMRTNPHPSKRESITCTKSTYLNMIHHNTMSVRCSLLPGRGTFVVTNDVIRFETKTDAKTIPMARTVIHDSRGWILGDEVVTFRGPCGWSHDTLQDVYTSGVSIVGVLDGNVFVGDHRNGACYARWSVACLQRMSRFSTTFDVVYVDVENPHEYVVTYPCKERDAVLKKLMDHVEHVFNLGADPYPWKRAITTAKKNKWVVNDWVYVFSDDVEDLDEESEEGEDEDDEAWEPPAKRARVSSSSEEEYSLEDESCSDDEASSI